MFDKTNQSFCDYIRNIIKVPQKSTFLRTDAKANINNKEVKDSRLIGLIESVTVNARHLEENLHELMKLCNNASSTNEGNGNSIVSTYASIDDNLSEPNLKCTEQEHATQSNSEVDAAHSNLFHGTVAKSDIGLCNWPIDDDSKRAKETKPLEDCTQKTTPRQETPRTLEDVDEDVLLEGEDTPEAGKDAHETVRKGEDFGASIPLKLEDTPRDGNAIQETSQTLEDDDENVLLEVKDSPQEVKEAEETVRMVENSEANIHLKLEDTPRDGNAIQETPQTLEDDDANFRLELEDIPRDGNAIQEALRTPGEVDANFRLELEDSLRRREVAQEATHILLEVDRNMNLDLDNTLEVIDESVLLELQNSSRERKETQQTAGILEADDANALLKLEDSPQKGRFIHKVPNVFRDEGDANPFLASEENASERKKEETIIKCVEDNVTDNNDLVLEETQLSLFDDTEIATISKCVLKSASFEIKEVTYSKEIARQLLFEWLSGQEGVTCYYYMCNEITIHVNRGATVTSTIDLIINTQFPQLRHIYRILYSDPGVCLPCAGPTWQTERGEPVLTPCDEEIVYPGKEIFCSSLDRAKYGTFSGKICGYGIAAGHMATSGSETAHTSSICFESHKIGIPILPVEYVRVPLGLPGTFFTRKTLADLLFFWLNDQDSVNNFFYGDPLNSRINEMFGIVLHRGPIKENDEVMVILRDERVKFGRIASIDYSDATVSNTLYIVDENNRALTVDGDSGAIVVLRPKRGDHNLKAIGVVTHLHWRLKPELEGTNHTGLNNENSIPVGTITNRLYDVLVATQQGAISGDPPEFRKIDLGHAPECIEFSGPLAATQEFDSGIQTHRSLDLGPGNIGF